MTAGKKDKRVYKDIASSLLKEGKTVRIEASGYSMYPTIKPGSITYIKPVSNQSELMHGDIIAWFREDGIIGHRLVCKYKVDDEYWYITRGDSSKHTDRPVSFKQIAGKVVSIEVKGKNKITVNKPFQKELRYKINSLRVWFLVRILAVLRRLGIKTGP